MKDIAELQRIAKSHLADSVIPRKAVSVEEGIKRFDEIKDRAAGFPYAKSHAIQAIDRDAKRLEVESRFAAIASPIGSIGAWLPKRVVILGERDAIVEYVSNVDSAIQKVGEVHFMTVVNDECTKVIYSSLDHALLHYLSAKHEGHSAAFDGSFVRYASSMLRIDSDGDE